MNLKSAERVRSMVPYCVNDSISTDTVPYGTVTVAESQWKRVGWIYRSPAVRKHMQTNSRDL